MNGMIAFLGTGPCNSADVLKGRIGQWVLVIVFVVASIVIVRNKILNKHLSLLKKLIYIVCLVAMGVVAASAIFIIGIGTACSDYGGYF